MTNKHTPAPWLYDAPENMVLDANGKLVAQPRSTDLGKEARNANGLLIAAAPALLDALQAALAVIADYLDYDHNGDPWTEDARTMGEMDINDYQHDGRLAAAHAAISRATGEPV